MTNHHIRILRDTALHAAQTILGVAHEHHAVASNHNLIHHDRAHELVKQGHAEWVGVAASAAPAHEAFPHHYRRHAEEHADMLSRHASEHREMRERHEAEHNAAIAAMGGVAAVTGF